MEYRWLLGTLPSRPHSTSFPQSLSLPSFLTLLPPGPTIPPTQARKGLLALHTPLPPAPPHWRPRFLWRRKSSSAHSPRNHKGSLMCSLPGPSINPIWVEADPYIEVQTQGPDRELLDIKSPLQLAAQSRTANWTNRSVLIYSLSC